MAAASTITVDDAIAAVLSEVGGIFTSKEKQQYRKLFEVDNFVLLHFQWTLVRVL